MSHGGGGGQKCHVLFEWPLFMDDPKRENREYKLKSLTRNVQQFNNKSNNQNSTQTLISQS
jgi:hypothetical protein